jgi:hypothetical protein
MEGASRTFDFSHRTAEFFGLQWAELGRAGVRADVSWLQTGVARMRSALVDVDPQLAGRQMPLPRERTQRARVLAGLLRGHTRLARRREQMGRVQVALRRVHAGLERVPREMARAQTALDMSRGRA